MIWQPQIPVTCCFIATSLYFNEAENMKKTVLLAVISGVVLAAGACTQETQNKIGRAVQNWTGTDGILEVYAGDKLVKRFMKIDKISTAEATNQKLDRPYRFGYGMLDANLNGILEPEEKKKVYFEFSDYSTSYIFYEDPR
jgi:hypothetical protein